MEVAIPILEVLLIGIPIILLLLNTVSPADRPFMTSVVLGGFALRLTVASIFVILPETRIFHEDAPGYEQFGMLLASSWRGEAPPIFLSDLGSITNGSFRGLFIFCGGLYYLFGRYQLVVTAFMSLVGSCSIVLIYRLGIQLFHPVVARRAALLMAFFPSMILWSALALKDAIMILLLLVSLNSLVALHRRLRFQPVIMLALAICAMWMIRFYVVYFVLFALASSVIFVRGKQKLGAFSRRIMLVGIMLGLFTVVGMSKNFASALERVNFDYLSTFHSAMVRGANSGFGGDVELSSFSSAMAFLPIGLPILLLGPFPWQMGSFRALLTAPEMLVWWSMFPAIWHGIRFSMRRRLDQVAPLLIFALTLCVFYALTLGNVGAAFRQRGQVFVFFFIFAAFGTYVKRCKKRDLDPTQLFAERERT